jgi:glycyl-tRNA synthetase
MREFEQMELEWFCHADTALADFSSWCSKRLAFYASIGINPDKIRLRPHAHDELAHYSTQCSDVEYHFPFGWKELEGIAHRGTFDLSQHSHHSGKDLSITDPVTGQQYTPTIVECSVGVDRLFLTLLFDAYYEDEVEGEIRTVLRLSPITAPIKAAFFPLSKKLNEPTHALYAKCKALGISIEYDESGSIGKRYRRQDEIGTPFCFTYDFESETDHCVTVRHRDSTHQERIAIDHILTFLQDKQAIPPLY